METINDYRALAFFDLDGTLLNADSELDDEVIDALAQIKKNGVLPFIATGRGHFELPRIMKPAGITGAITMNGQYIIYDDETIFKSAIPTTAITKLLELADSCDEALSFYDDDHYWVSQLTEYAREAYGHFHQTMPVADRNAYLTDEVNMLLVLTDKLSQVAFYKERIPELNFYMNSPSSIDVTNSFINKGTGVAEVKKIFGFTGETYAFGDGRNDLDLLAACDHKTAMGNAVPELKALADFVTTDNTNHGIINAFKHWGLL